MRTPTHLLAIAGLGLVLGTGHALTRSLVFGAPAVSLPKPLVTQPVPQGATPQTASGTPAGTTDPASNTVRDPAVTNPSEGTAGDASGDTAAESGEATPTEGAPPVTDAGQPVNPLDAPVHPGQITLREAFDLFEQGAWFLDARNQDDFNAGRIDGAIWMPASRAGTGPGQDDLDLIPPGEIVVIYCTGGDCDASHNTAHRLGLLQYNFDIRILGKGYIDWFEAGLPVQLPDDASDDGEAQP